MLDQLRAYLQSPDLSNDPFVRLDSIKFIERDGFLNLSVLDYDGSQTWKSWCVRAHGLYDFDIRSPYGDLFVHERDHILARQYTDSQYRLTFRGSPQSVPAAVGRLLIAHRREASNWIAFERYVNRGCHLDDLLAGGFGQLGDGPLFLMQEYARVLEAEGIAASLLGPSPAKWWDGNRWIEYPATMATLVIGEAFFVADDFEAGEVTGENP